MNSSFLKIGFIFMTYWICFYDLSDLKDLCYNVSVTMMSGYFCIENTNTPAVGMSVVPMTAFAPAGSVNE